MLLRGLRPAEILLHGLLAEGFERLGLRIKLERTFQGPRDAALIGVQKMLIRKARRADRIVITATQMMESMVQNPIPTRARPGSCR